MISIQNYVKRLFLIKNQLKNFSQFLNDSNASNTTLKYKFKCGAVKIPHYSKKEKGGEDALVVHEDMISVADGVGGWSNHGVDPAIFSNHLSYNIKKYFLEDKLKSINDPMQFFVKACNNTQVIGSSTCCICVLDSEKKTIKTLNLGDSGYLILRPVMIKEEDSLHKFDLEIVFKSNEQTHEFNFPFQVGTSGDNPESAMKMVHDFQVNDIIVLATDGLWDNLYDTQILSIIKPFLSKSIEIKEVELVAEMIGNTAELFSFYEKYNSPFALRSKGIFEGGKPDDVTIIVAQIINNL